MTKAASTFDLAQSGTTFPQLLLAHAAARPDAPALREKDLGIWQAISWRQLREDVEAIAAGLFAEGFGRGQHLALVGENRPRLYAAMVAAQAIGGIPVPLYQDAVANELIYVFQNAEIAYALVEDQEQTDKMLEVAQSHPLLKRIVYDDPRGMRNYRQPALMSIESLIAHGHEYLQSHPGFLRGAGREAVAGRRGRDVLHLRHHRARQGRGAHPIGT
jgi:long-chain acyl-CoA synthetase